MTWTSEFDGSSDYFVNQFSGLFGNQFSEFLPSPPLSTWQIEETLGHVSLSGSDDLILENFPELSTNQVDKGLSDDGLASQSLSLSTPKPAVEEKKKRGRPPKPNKVSKVVKRKKYEEEPTSKSVLNAINAKKNRELRRAREMNLEAREKHLEAENDALKQEVVQLKTQLETQNINHKKQLQNILKIVQIAYNEDNGMADV